MLGSRLSYRHQDTSILRESRAGLLWRSGFGHLLLPNGVPFIRYSSKVECGPGTFHHLKRQCMVLRHTMLEPHRLMSDYDGDVDIVVGSNSAVVLIRVGDIEINSEFAAGAYQTFSN